MVPRLPADYVAARARLDADHRINGRNFPKCVRCGLPLTLGQIDRHWLCVDVEAVDTAEADHAQWQADGAPEPQGRLDVRLGAEVVDVPTGGRL